LSQASTDVLFAAKSNDIPAALAIAQDVEANHERSAFAASFANGQEDRKRKITPRPQGRQQDRNQQQESPQANGSKNPHFTRQQRPQNQSEQQSGSQEPMDVDPSSSKIL